MFHYELDDPYADRTYTCICNLELSKLRVGFSAGKIALSPSLPSTSIFPTDSSSVVGLSLHVGGFTCGVCFVIFCSSLLLLVPRKGCASWLWLFLGIFTYIFAWHSPWTVLRKNPVLGNFCMSRPDNFIYLPYLERETRTVYTQIRHHIMCHLIAANFRHINRQSNGIVER